MTAPDSDPSESIHFAGAGAAAEGSADKKAWMSPKLILPSVSNVTSKSIPLSLDFHSYSKAFGELS